jgi:hypothetical protein
VGDQLVVIVNRLNGFKSRVHLRRQRDRGDSELKQR